MSPSRIWKLFWVLLFAGIVLFVSQLRGCKRGWVISAPPPVAISDDGDRIAFSAGSPTEEGRTFIQPDEAHLFVLDLTRAGGKAIEIKQAKGTAPWNMTWRPSTSPAALYVALPCMAEPNIAYRLLGIKASNPPTTVFSGELTEWTVDTVGGLGWSPDGSILATWSFVSGLRFSFDGGKTFVLSSLSRAGMGRFAWKNNAALYVCKEDKIQELDVKDGKATITRMVASGKDVRLFGVLDGEAVHLLENTIYRGDTVLYESSEKVALIQVDSPYVAFQVKPNQEDSRVFVLDKDGNTVSERKMLAQMILIGLSSKRKTAYLLKDLRAIQVYNFVNNGPVSTLYRLW